MLWLPILSKPVHKVAGVLSTDNWLWLVITKTTNGILCIGNLCCVTAYFEHMTPSYISSADEYPLLENCGLHTVGTF